MKEMDLMQKRFYIFRLCCKQHGKMLIYLIAMVLFNTININQQISSSCMLASEWKSHEIITFISIDFFSLLTSIEYVKYILTHQSYPENIFSHMHSCLSLKQTINKENKQLMNLFRELLMRLIDIFVVVP